MEFKLRRWEETDADSLAKHANNLNISQNLTNQFPHPYSLKNAQDFIEMAQSHELTQVFAIDVNGEAVGGIGLHGKSDVYVKNMEMGYWLAEPYWGNGIVTKAVISMVDYGFVNFDITRIYAKPFGPNIGSQKVLEKAGFSLEATLEKTFYKNGEFLDELIYGIRANRKL